MVEQRGGELEVPRYYVGEWFKPFVGYEALREAKEDTTDNYSVVESTAMIEQVGELRSALMWLRQSYSRGMIITASESVPVPSEDTDLASKRLGARLVWPTFYFDLDTSSYQVELNFGHSKEIYTSFFKYYTGLQASVGHNKWQGTGIAETALYFPELGYILNSINVRIAPIPNGRVEE